MSYLTHTHHPAPVAASPAAQLAASSRPLRVVLLVAVALAVALAHLLGQGEAAVRAAAADPELTRLLRGMAALKAGLALSAVCLVAWRLGYPAGTRLVVGLVAAAASMAAGPVLIWHVAPVAAAALLFHAGLGLLLVLCLTDRSGAQELCAAASRRRTIKR